MGRGFTMKKKYVIAYMRDGGLETITEEDAKKLTHVNLAFGKIDSEGKIYTKLKLSLIHIFLFLHSLPYQKVQHQNIQLNHEELILGLLHHPF